MQRAVGVATTLLVSLAVTCVSTAASPAPALAPCADSVYQARSMAAVQALRLGPVVFNHLASSARHDVTRPSKQVPFYRLATFADVARTAPHGVVVGVTDARGPIAIFYGTGDHWRSIVGGRLRLRDAAHVVRFAVCRDPSTHEPLETQYGVSFALQHPGCFTLSVHSVGRRRRFTARVRVLSPRC